MVQNKREEPLKIIIDIVAPLLSDSLLHSN
jgi:hypothetical protein